MLRCGTENDTCTFSRLPKVPRQAFSRMLPTSVITSRAEASIDSGSAGSLVSSSFRIAAPDFIEDQQRVAGDRAGEDLVHAGDVALDDPLERVADLVDRVQRDLRHVEQHAVAGQLRERRGSAAEPDVQQLDERVLLERR